MKKNPVIEMMKNPAAFNPALMPCLTSEYSLFE
jgi:hypothetical protein